MQYDDFEYGEQDSFHTSWWILIILLAIIVTYSASYVVCRTDSQVLKEPIE